MVYFIKTTIKLREYFKFIYTKNLSLAIEIIAEIGEEFSINRDDLSNLDYFSIVSNINELSSNELTNRWKNLIKGRVVEKKLLSQISLPPIIFSERDFEIVPSYISKPNFITNEIIEGEFILLDQYPNINSIDKKIIVLEKADPGYDWIFTKKIKGLITKYGGVASHMSIRCAEFGIPAAIGCGDLIFSKLKNHNFLILDCRNKTINSY
jgi:phosphohistidine swiveling domain-containing protein